MDAVKTYHAVNAQNKTVRFEISKMEAIYARRNGRTDEPHRHDFFTVLLVRNAKGQHKIDFNTYALEARQIFFVSPGQVHQVIEEQASEGYVMTFSCEFLVENAIETVFIDGLNLFQNYGQSPPLKPSEAQFERITQHADAMFQLFHSEVNMKELSLGAFLKLILIECNNICSMHPIEPNDDISENRIIREFKQSVNDAYKTEHSAAFYASQLHITPDHLNRIIKSAIGKTVKEYIHSKLITEAKRLLFFSELSNKEIGFELGFAEPANFSAFFKKNTGVSPSSFKKKELAR